MLITNVGAIKSLIYVLKTGTKTSKQNVACALLSLAFVEENKGSIGAFGVILSLVSMLLNGSRKGKKDALMTLYKLCSVRKNKERAVSADAVKPLVELVAEQGNDTAEKAMVVLNSLARLSPVANTLIRFSYDEILSTTRNFSKGNFSCVQRVLGRSALSYVFRGRVGIWRTVVAIKRLDKEDKECAKAFCRELMIASSLNDTNVVPLVGFCIDSKEGLFWCTRRKKGVKGSSPLPWSVRYKVAIGIAEGVAYLHNVQRLATWVCLHGQKLAT
ncbi:hypothetical protein JHK85_019185 [Glycine max]|nr:hypothetical protein JHK85_019185 [Glycine max]